MEAEEEVKKIQTQCMKFFKKTNMSLDKSGLKYVNT